MLESISSEAGDQCVDLFEDPAGGLGFELLRADPEDGGRWTVVGGYDGNRPYFANGLGDHRTVRS